MSRSDLRDNRGDPPFRLRFAELLSAGADKRRYRRRHELKIRILVLSAHKALHHLEVAFGQPKRGVRPDTGDAHQLVVRDGFDVAPNHLDRAPSIRRASMLFHKAVYRGLATIVGRENIHHTEVVQLTTGVHVPSGNEFFRGAAPHLPRKKTVRSHARKEVEQDLWKSHADRFFRDKH